MTSEEYVGKIIMRDRVRRAIAELTDPSFDIVLWVSDSTAAVIGGLHVMKDRLSLEILEYEQDQQRQKNKER